MGGLPAWPYPRLAAHRGAGKLAPENTLAALRLGHAHGYRMAEIDVKLSADGVAFLLPVDTLDRTSNGRGRADALTWRELAQLDAGSWHSSAYAGEPIASLSSVAQWARANGVVLNIEIKPMPGRERETGAAVALDAKRMWAGADAQPLLSSFSSVALDAAREAASELPRAYLLEELAGDWRGDLVRLGCVGVNPRHTLLTQDLVRDLRGAGWRIATWTVNDIARAEELAQWGLDTLITDAVDSIVPDSIPPR